MVLVLGLLNMIGLRWQLSEERNRNRVIGRILQQMILGYIVYQVIALDSWGGEIVQYDGLSRQNVLILSNELYLMVIAQMLLQVTTSSSAAGETELKKSEIYLILMTAIIGMLELINSNDWIVTILALQLINLSQYFQLSVNKQSESALSAGQKYLQQSAFTTAILLLAIAFLYSITGTTHYDGIEMVSHYLGAELRWPLFLIQVAVLFKLGAAPFHHWAPDVYDGIPTNITIWLATQPKIALQVFQVTLFPLLELSSLLNFQVVPAVLSLFIGSVGLGAQLRIKRFIALSTVSHMGFLLLAYSHSDQSSFFYYYLIYALTSINIFTIQIAISPRQDLLYQSQLSGLFLFNKPLALALAFSFLSLAGIPPLAGFFAKVWVLVSVIHLDNQQLAFLAILSSTISTAFYIRQIKISHQDTPLWGPSASPNRVALSPSYAFLIASQTTFLIQFLFKPATFQTLTSELLILSH